MTNEYKLIRIKLIHTAIWVFFNIVIFYIVYAVFMEQFDLWLWIAYGIIILEGIILVIFRFYCPLTLLAQTYSRSDKANFDIYLPEWLAKYNKSIYSSIMVVTTVVLIVKLWEK